MKKGFTLLELLAVIALLSILVLLVVPGFINIFNQSVEKTMQLEESNILDAARLYREDYCISPIDSTYVCPNSYINSKYICLKNLKSVGLITKDIKYKGNMCSGVILFKNGNITKDSVFLACGTQNDGYYTDKNIYNKENYTDCN